MKELVEVIAKSLVENPDEVVVTETETKAIRTVVKAASSKSSKKVIVDILQ